METKNYWNRLYPAYLERATQFLEQKGFERFSQEKGHHVFTNNQGLYIDVVDQNRDPPETWVGKKPAPGGRIGVGFLLEAYLTGKNETLETFRERVKAGEQLNSFEYVQSLLENHLDAIAAIDPFPEAYYDWQKKSDYVKRLIASLDKKSEAPADQTNEFSSPTENQTPPRALNSSKTTAISPENPVPLPHISSKSKNSATMSRLTPFARILIVMAIVAAIFFGVKHFFPGVIGGGDTTTTTEDTTTPPADDATTGTETTTPADNSGGTATTNTSSFSYTAPEPVNGKLKGVVELGATGFNSFIINVDAQKNWKLAKADYGSSLVYESMTNDAEVTAGLKNYISNMLAFGVGGKDIHFVISSGAQKVEETKKIIAALKKMNYFVNTVTPEQEGQLALKSVLPASYNDKAFVVDIGSGNTKISWIQGNSVIGKEAYGAKYYQKSITDDAAYQNAAAMAKGVPAAQRGTCFIIGGVPFELAKQGRNGKERYTMLKAPGDYKADGEKQKAGLNIYKAVADATGCKEFVFDWDANFTIGFLLTL